MYVGIGRVVGGWKCWSGVSGVYVTVALFECCANEGFSCTVFIVLVPSTQPHVQDIAPAM